MKQNCGMLVVSIFAIPKSLLTFMFLTLILFSPQYCVVRVPLYGRTVPLRRVYHPAGQSLQGVFYPEGQSPDFLIDPCDN